MQRNNLTLKSSPPRWVGPLTPDDEPVLRIPVAPAHPPPQVPAELMSDEALAEVGSIASRIIDNVELVLVGKRREIILALVACLAEGHLLLEDVPGVAKTMLARALAQSVGGSFKRVQCTPDLLPNDITGTSIFHPKTAEFEFRPGPLFAQFVLADEINRASPRTQSALLEAMSEGQVTVDGNHYALGRPFFLVATQNPIDHEGTFPLPEAQLDRFLMRLSLGYPSFEEEGRILERLQLGHPVDSLQAVVSAEQVAQCQQSVRRVHVEARVRDYMLSLVHATRSHDAVALGGSPRASLALFRASQALAAVQGVPYVMPDDVKQVAGAVLAHRLILRPENRLRQVSGAQVIEQILHQVPVPVLPDNRI